MHEQNKNFSKETVTLKKILELKNTITELKNSIESFITRLDCAEERINDLEARTLPAPVSWDIICSCQRSKKEKKNEKNEESPWDSWDTMKRNNIYIIGIPGEMKE